MVAFQAVDPGSTPGRRNVLVFMYFCFNLLVAGKCLNTWAEPNMAFVCYMPDLPELSFVFVTGKMVHF